MIPVLLSAGWASVSSVISLFSCCFFVRQALAKRVDGARGLHNSEATDFPAFLRNGLKHHSHATLSHLDSLSLIFRLVLIAMLEAPFFASTRGKILESGSFDSYF